MSTVRAKEPFSFDADGYSHNVAAGALFDSADPTVTKRPTLFEPVELAAARRSSAISTPLGTETASAAPGERRARGRARTTSEPEIAETAADEPKGDN